MSGNKTDSAPQRDPVEDLRHASRDATSSLRAKWGAALDSGYIALPAVLVTYFAELKVTPTQFLVLLVLLSHWWTAGSKPFPRVSTIARRLDATPRTVQRALNALRAAGLIDWTRCRFSMEGYCCTQTLALALAEGCTT
jgi:DNA-binding transcriptional ArsR family regulator